MLITIEKLIFEGYGMGHAPDGRIVLVKKVVPGDQVEVDITKSKKNFAEGIVRNVIKPSQFRIDPVCSHFDSCGGCEHQNISYKDQLRLKEEIFQEVLSRAKVDTEILPIIPGSGQEYYYRNTIRFLLDTDKDGCLIYQMHDFADFTKFIEIKSCLLQSDFCKSFMASFKEFADVKIDNKKDLRQLRIREGKQTGDFMIEIFTKNPLPQKDQLVSFLKKFPQIKSAFHCIGSDKGPDKLERRLIVGSPVIYEKIGKFTFQISPQAFFQTNSLGVKTLYDKIKEFADVKIGDKVLDLFCGTGTIGIYLSTFAKKVTGVELVQSAVNDARANAKINHLSNCEFIRDDVEKWLENYSSSKSEKPSQQSSPLTGQESNDNHFDVIIVDPPRQGLTKRTIALISKLLNADCRLVYVSCDPATFARDIKEFEKLGHKLKKAEPLDMFPQTHHIECIGLIR